MANATLPIQSLTFLFLPTLAPASKKSHTMWVIVAIVCGVVMLLAVIALIVVITVVVCIILLLHMHRYFHLGCVCMCVYEAHFNVYVIVHAHVDNFI